MSFAKAIGVKGGKEGRPQKWCIQDREKDLKLGVWKERKTVANTF